MTGRAPVWEAASLNAARRACELEALDRSGPVDLLVVGGGVTGAGVALDAASRGLSVVLVEKHDLAFGTSRWSSKLVHGGLRYLATGHVPIAYESAVERATLMQRVAPHLVHPFAQLVPVFAHVTHRDVLVARVGLRAGDLLRVAAGTPRALLPPPRKVSTSQVRAYAPGIGTEKMRGSFLAWDGQLEDDARLVVALARTAAAYRARILTHCAASQVTGHGAVLLDDIGGRSHQVDARMVVNATGVWAGEIDPGITLRPSRGTHLVLSRESIGPLSAGVMVLVPGTHDRFVLVLPAPDGRVYVGLTDEESPGPVPDVPHATESEVEFLLSVLNTVLRRPVRRDEVLGTYAGLRPLLDTGTGETADISRRHAVVTRPDGLVTVVGGKLTTYRKMAEDAVDAAVSSSTVHVGPCRTRTLPLVGAADRGALAAVDAPRRLVRRYGTEAPAVLAQAAGDTALLEPVADGTDVTGAELAFALRHEGALDEEDLLERRTRIGLVPADRERARPAARAALAGAADLGVSQPGSRSRV